MRTREFNFDLPDELIAQHPARERDQSKLLVLHRDSGRREHRLFGEILNYFQAGDVLVLNDSRVIPARLRGTNVQSGGVFELLLLEEITVNEWWAMLKPGRRARLGTEIELLSTTGKPSGFRAHVMEVNQEGHRRLKFSGGNLRDSLAQLGQVPLPPYIVRRRGECLVEDEERYQTVYARSAGSVAAPTAGLHFTPQLLGKLSRRGVEIHFITLHVGLGTFAPVKAEKLSEHKMHQEQFEVSDATARAVNSAKAEGRRLFAVGTTTVRVLESVAVAQNGQLIAGRGGTDIFIHPPRDFKVVDALLTNFHLPCSTLLMLVSAFAAPGGTGGREIILSAYAEAIRERYRFFSYGDAMLIL